MRRLYVAESDIHGVGVFTETGFHANELIEESPVLVFSENDRRVINGTELFNYYFGWPDVRHGIGAFALGFGSLMNHSYQPNARYIKDIAKGVIRFVALEPITSRQEITVNYNGRPDDEAPVWFDASSR